jgi:hypothetical protein
MRIVSTAGFVPSALTQAACSVRFRRCAASPTRRDKATLDIFWSRDESFEDIENLPPPVVIAAEIVEDLEAALAEFSLIAESLGEPRRDAELGALCSSPLSTLRCMASLRR